MKRCFGDILLAPEGLQIQWEDRNVNGECKQCGMYAVKACGGGNDAVRWGLSCLFSSGLEMGVGG